MAGENLSLGVNVRKDVSGRMFGSVNKSNHNIFQEIQEKVGSVVSSKEEGQTAAAGGEADDQDENV